MDYRLRPGWTGALCAGVLGIAMALPASAANFAVTPIRAELKPGVLSETISVTNESASRLRATVRLMEWTQDASGADVYTESSDLVYFPRQLDIEAGAKRLVRVGARSLQPPTEKTYRLFIEEVPEPLPHSAPAAVAFYFRFGIPVFLTPASAQPRPAVSDPVLSKGRVTVTVRNEGNQHFRLTRVAVSDGAEYRQELTGWYSLAGSTRTYSWDLPVELCRRSRTLVVRLEGEGLNLERQLTVDPSACA